MNSKNPATTAEWEARLEAIADGRERNDVFLERKQCAVLPGAREHRGDSTPAFPVPTAARAALRRQSMKDNKSWFWGCSGYPSCKTTLPDDNGNPGKRGSELSPNSNVPTAISLCAKLNGAKGEFFGCSGYPECKKSFPMGSGWKTGLQATQFFRGGKIMKFLLIPIFVFALATSTYAGSCQDIQGKRKMPPYPGKKQQGFRKPQYGNARP